MRAEAYKRAIEKQLPLLQQYPTREVVLETAMLVNSVAMSFQQEEIREIAGDIFGMCHPEGGDEEPTQEQVNWLTQAGENLINLPMAALPATLGGASTSAPAPELSEP